MRTKFYLRKGSEKSTIQFEFRSGKNARFRASTNFVINSDKDWDSNKQKMKLPSSTLNAKLINSKLSEFENLLNDLLYKQNEKQVEIDAIKCIFTKVFDICEKPISKFQSKTFSENQMDLDVSKDFIKYYEFIKKSET